MRSTTLLSLSVSGAVAFSSSARHPLVSTRLSSSIQDEMDLTPEGSSQLLPEPRSVPDKSEALPFLDYPPVLAESDLAGNLGFDPLRLSTNQGQLLEYREAEVKHARLAMLATVGYPLSELYDKQIAEYYDLEPVLQNGSNMAPSLLNGGLERVSPVFWGFCLGLTASIDMYGVAKSRSGDLSYFPGNLGFDPLNFYPSDPKDQKRMQLAEIKHGRVAMMAFTGFSVQEYVTKVGVIDETPWFFLPFIPVSETMEEMGMLSAWQ